MGQATQSMTEFNSECDEKLKALFEADPKPTLESALRHVAELEDHLDAVVTNIVSERKDNEAEMQEMTDGFMKHTDKQDDKIKDLEHRLDNFRAKQQSWEKERVNLLDVITADEKEKVQLKHDLDRTAREFGRLLAAHHKAVGSGIREGI